MTEHRELIVRPSFNAGPSNVPALFRDAGEQAWYKFVEFFTARIRNRNTREAYGRAARHFSEWCVTHQVELLQLTPLHVAAYVEFIDTTYAKPTVKQHLAAIRMLFDFFVVGQVVPSNPTASVRGPKCVVSKGKTPVLTAQELRALLDSVETDTLIGLRD